jgi:chemotaxis signal transduction protein
MKRGEDTERTCIIVVESIISGGVVAIGMAVDAVSEVVSAKADDIEPLPAFGINHHTDYILGAAKIENNVKLHLDIDRVIECGRCEAILKAA